MLPEVESRIVLPGLKFAAAKPFLHHSPRRPIFYRAARIEPFQFRIDFYGRGQAFGNPLNLEQGSVADQIENRLHLLWLFPRGSY